MTTEPNSLHSLTPSLSEPNLSLTPEDDSVLANVDSVDKTTVYDDKEIDDLYVFRNDAEWFQINQKDLQISKEKCQAVLTIVPRHAEHQLDLFAQQCLHLFTSDWTVLRSNYSFSVAEISEQDSVCFSFDKNSQQIGTFTCPFSAIFTQTA